MLDVPVSRARLFRCDDNGMQPNCPARVGVCRIGCVCLAMVDAGFLWFALSAALPNRPANYLITELKEQSLRSYMNTSPQPDRLVILRMASEIVSAIDFLCVVVTLHNTTQCGVVVLAGGLHWQAVPLQ